MKDNVTGVRRVGEGGGGVESVAYERPLVIGTIRAVRVGVRADCCQRGVTLR